MHQSLKQCHISVTLDLRWDICAWLSRGTQKTQKMEIQTATMVIALPQSPFLRFFAAIASGGPAGINVRSGDVMLIPPCRCWLSSAARDSARLSSIERFQ